MSDHALLLGGAERKHTRVRGFAEWLPHSFRKFAFPLHREMSSPRYLASRAITAASRIRPTMRLTAGRRRRVTPALGRAPRWKTDRPKLRRGMAHLVCIAPRTISLPQRPRRRAPAGRALIGGAARRRAHSSWYSFQ